MGREQEAEHGLGAACVKNRSSKCTTGTPVTASGCNQFISAAALRPFSPQGVGESRWYHEVFFRLSSLFYCKDDSLFVLFLPIFTKEYLQNIMFEIKHLTKIFPARSNEVVALKDVSTTIHTGDIFGIIGMSGAGKSTLLRCLCLLEQPTDGQILLNGKDLAHLKGKELLEARRQMGVVFQGYNLLMQKTVAENVAFPLKLTAYDKQAMEKRVAELLELVGLADKAGSYPSQLSGGQKQRVALARALASNPQVLLCDEPTSALDPLTTKSVLQLLKDINHKLGVTVIIITHELAVVKSICNRMVVIDNGEFVEQGETETIFKNPQSNMARLLLGKED